MSKASAQPKAEGYTNGQVEADIEGVKAWQ
jgi:hypothetical protein